MALIKLSKELIDETKSKNRNVSKQIEHWAKIGRMIEANPDLTYDFVKKVLKAQKQAREGKVVPYKLT